MKIKYDGSNKVSSITEVFGQIFSMHYYDYDETPKGFSIILLGREWTWLVGEWKDDE